MVRTATGHEVPVPQAGIGYRQMGEDADDPELSEYVARVEWTKHGPLSLAVR